ncbi:MAG: phosphatase PAP2 family protein [Polaromonas sp.]|uniref:bifunctional DedA family/phosphatase PAP2 family protein n=1 Tax=Polaromonas sp. TaxID=1869339 RepID=UPI0017FAD8EF|nr:bifunctional DedA family/phosphatase PAP2 family protein [Polaromonas sp.]NMM10608.1 phosphatase PAP2 family protein [Polaromonas sp.]
MLQYLINLIGRLGQWGYLVIFVGAMLESAAFVGLVIPGESLVLVAGFLAAQGLLDLDLLIAVVAVGAVVGDSLGYEMGRRMGRPALTQYGGRLGLTDARVSKADAFFSRHGSKAVFLGRFVGFARAVVPFLAGSSRMAYRKFLPYNVAGAVLWASAVALLGYFLGASWHTAERWMGRASALLGGLAVFALLLIWLWRWAARHEGFIRQVGYRLLQQPRIRTLALRFAPQLAFIRNRLSPRNYLGLQLTIGAGVLIGASWLFGGIAEDVVSGDPLTVIDLRVAQWFHAHATPLLTQVMRVVTHLHDPIPVTAAVLLMASYLAWKRDWYWFICVNVTIPFGMLLNVLMKYAFHRARPSFDDPLVALSSYSFPSGHVAGATLFYGVVAAMLVKTIHGWRWRVMIVLASIALVILVALTRIYLGAHYLSDVLAAFAEGVAWLTLCLTAMHTYWQHSRRNLAPHPKPNPPGHTE